MLTLIGRLGEIVEMLESSSVDICCVQDITFRRKSVRIMSGKAAEYKLLLIGNEKDLGVRIFLSKKWVDKIIDVSK